MIKLYWYLTGYIRKHGLKFLVALLFFAGFFSLVLPYLVRNFSHRRTFYIGLVGEYDLNNLPSEVKSLLSRGLVTYRDNGSFAPDLAASINIEPVEGELRRYRFALEDGLVWQDGKEFTATDVNYHLRDAQVTYEGNEVIYDLPAVLASFPQLLTEPLLRFVPQKKFGLINEIKVYGIGSTRLTSYQWQDSSHRALSQVVLDDLETRTRLVYRFYYTQNQAIDAFKLGKVDILNDISNVDEVKWATNRIQEVELADQYLAVFFNTADPLLTRGVRQALSYAVEKDRPGFERATGPISKTSWAYFPNIKKYDKNIDSGVERLLDELPHEPIEIELVTTASYFDIASRIKEDWEELGEAAVAACLGSEEIEDKDNCEYLHIQTNIQIQTIPDTNNFQTMLVGQQIPADPDQYNLWHSDLATNFTHYQNTRVDNLLEKGRQTVKQEERTALYQEFQQNLLEDPPAIFLWYLRTYNLGRGSDNVLIDLSQHSDEPSPPPEAAPEADAADPNAA